MKLSSVRVLGACGLAASLCAALGGFFDRPALLGAGGAVMFLGNLYALVSKT